MSVGSRSRRVDSICPNLTKIGPRSSSARRRRTARGADRSRQNSGAVNERAQPAQARVVEREIVETVLERDNDDPSEATKPHALF